jgi:hypothetical protein
MTLMPAPDLRSAAHESRTAHGAAANTDRTQCSNLTPMFKGMHRNTPLSPMKRVPGCTIPMVPMHFPPMAPRNLVEQNRARLICADLPDSVGHLWIAHHPLVTAPLWHNTDHTGSAQIVGRAWASDGIRRRGYLREIWANPEPCGISVASIRPARPRQGAFIRPERVLSL